MLQLHIIGVIAVMRGVAVAMRTEESSTRPVYVNCTAYGTRDNITAAWARIIQRSSSLTTFIL